MVHFNNFVSRYGCSSFSFEALEKTMILRYFNERFDFIRFISDVVSFFLWIHSFHSSERMIGEFEN
jgi:hypothetical protein